MPTKQKGNLMPLFQSCFRNSTSFSSSSEWIVRDVISSNGVVRSFNELDEKRTTPSEERKGLSEDSARVKICFFVIREDWESQLNNTPLLRPVLNNISSVEIQIDDLN